MDNKKLGIILIVFCLVLGFIIFGFNNMINVQTEAACDCEDMKDAGFCPHDQGTPWQMYLGVVLLSAVAALGVYLIFFDKSQKEIVSALESQKQIKVSDEKFSILLMGLSDEEKKIIKAVKEQQGITQQTLRLRVDMHKSKLSIVLDGLEKKGLVSRVEKGKTKQVFLKISF